MPPRRVTRKTGSPITNNPSPTPTVGAPTVTAAPTASGFVRSNAQTQANDFFAQLGVAGNLVSDYGTKQLAKERKNLQERGALDAYEASLADDPDIQKYIKTVNNPYYTQAFMEQYGRQSADKLGTQVASQLEQQKNTLQTPDQVIEMYDEAARPYLESQDQDYLAGFLPVFAANQEKAVAGFTAFNDKRIYDEGVKQHYADLRTRLEADIDAGKTPEQMSATMAASRLDGRDFHNLSNPDINEDHFEAIKQLAAERLDERLFDVFNYPGPDGTPPLSKSKKWDTRILAARLQIRKAATKEQGVSSAADKFATVRELTLRAQVGELTESDVFPALDAGLLSPEKANSLIQQSDDFRIREGTKLEIRNDIVADPSLAYQKHPNDPELVDETFQEMMSEIALRFHDNPQLAMSTIAELGAFSNIQYDPLRRALTNGFQSNQPAVFQNAYTQYSALRNVSPNYAAGYLDDTAMANVKLYERRLEAGDKPAEAQDYVIRSTPDYRESQTALPTEVINEVDEALADADNYAMAALVRRNALKLVYRGEQPEDAVELALQQGREQYLELGGGGVLHRRYVPDNWGTGARDYLEDVLVPELTGLDDVGAIRIQPTADTKTTGAVQIFSEDWRPLYTKDHKPLVYNLRDVGRAYARYVAEETERKLQLRKRYGASAGRRKQTRNR